MSKVKEINWNSIEDKLSGVSFELFRFWTKESNINDNIIIKTEQNLIKDLKEAIVKAIRALNRKKDLDKKPNGWDIGFIIGFIDGYLGKHWYHEYITKNGEEYKTYTGLRAIKGYLKTNEVTEINIDKLYEDLLYENSNIDNLSLNVNRAELNVNNLEVNQHSEKGKVLTILNNLIMKQIKIVAELENKIQLPIGDVFTTDELKKLIEDNKK